MLSAFKSAVSSKGTEQQVKTNIVKALALLLKRRTDVRTEYIDGISYAVDNCLYQALDHIFGNGPPAGNEMFPTKEEFSTWIEKLALMNMQELAKKIENGPCNTTLRRLYTQRDKLKPTVPKSSRAPDRKPEPSVKGYQPTPFGNKTPDNAVPGVLLNESSPAPDRKQQPSVQGYQPTPDIKKTPAKPVSVVLLNEYQNGPLGRNSIADLWKTEVVQKSATQHQAWVAENLMSITGCKRQTTKKQPDLGPQIVEFRTIALTGIDAAHRVQRLEVSKLGNGVYADDSTMENATFGLFAGKHFNENDFITEYDGERLTDQQYDEIVNKGRLRSYVAALRPGNSYIDGFQMPYDRMGNQLNIGGGSFANDNIFYFRSRQAGRVMRCTRRPVNAELVVLTTAENAARSARDFDPSQARLMLVATRPIEPDDEILVRGTEYFGEDVQHD